MQIKKQGFQHCAETLVYLCGTYWIRTSDLMRVKHAL